MNFDNLNNNIISNISYNAKTSYLSLFFFVFFLDRMSKLWALSLGMNEKIINDSLSFLLIYNRGVSWGLFSSYSNIIFYIVTLIIILVTISVAFYAVYRYRSSYLIYGEILVISGSISNIIDRFLYDGVIDFILLKYGDFTWPVFNIADISIVLGVIIMFFYSNDLNVLYLRSK